MKQTILCLLFFSIVKQICACPDISSLTIKGSDKVCYNAEAQFTVDSLAGCSYYFSAEGISVVHSNSYTVKLIANQSKSFVLICSVNNGCETKQLNRTIQIDTSLVTADLLVNSKSLPLKVCENSPYTVTPTNYSSIDCSIDFIPSGSMTLTTGIYNFKITYPKTTGQYSIVATFSGSCGTRTKQWDVTVFDNPSISAIIGKDSVCAKSKAEFSVVATQVDSLIWKCNAKRNAVSNYLNLGAELLFADSLPRDTLRVSVKNACGEARIQKPIAIQQPYCEQLGVATFDQYTSASILLAWERTSNKKTVKYEALREFGSEGDFRPIAIRPFGEYGLVEDTASDSRTRPYRYRLRTYDDCGNYADSKIHTTMHVQMSKIDQIYNLKWNRYEGLPLSNYVVYEHIGNTFTVLDTIPAIEKWSEYSFSIPNYKPEARYRVGFQIPNIDIKKVKTDTGPFSQSFSNMSEASLVSEKFLHDPSLNMYPNPCSNLLIINADPFSKIVIVSQLGVELFSSICPSTGQLTIEPLLLKSGIYMVSAVKNNTLTTQKIIVQ